MLRLASDADVHGEIIRGLRRRLPDLDLVRVQGGGSLRPDHPNVISRRWQPGINVDESIFAATFQALACEPRVVSREAAREYHESWARASVRTRLDVVTAHKYTELRAIANPELWRLSDQQWRHYAAVKNAPETPLRISEAARELLRLHWRALGFEEREFEMALIHYLYIGHFIPEQGLVRSQGHQPFATRPISMRTAVPLLGRYLGDAVDPDQLPAEWGMSIAPEYIVCDQIGAAPAALRFAADYAEQEGAMIVDLGSFALLTPEQLRHSATLNLVR